jgi:hypothetical protein
MMARKFKVEDGHDRYATIREENGLFEVDVWRVSHGSTADGARVHDEHLWGSREHWYEEKCADYEATINERLVGIENLRMTLAGFDMKLPEILSAELLAGLNDRVSQLKSRIAGDVEALGHNPSLVWLLRYVSYEAVSGMVSGGGFDEMETAAVQAVARELGASDEQLNLILFA